MSPDITMDGNDTAPLSDERLANLRDFPWLPGFVTGAVTWIVGYVLFVSLVYLGPASLGDTTPAERLKAIANLFYNAQFVERIVIAPADLSIMGGRRTNFLLEANVQHIPLPVYLAVPIVAILVVAIVFGVVSMADTADYGEAGLAGVAIALGYVAIALLGTVLFSVTLVEGSVEARPDRLQTLAFGFAYPFAFGTLGTLVGIVYNRR